MYISRDVTPLFLFMRKCFRPGDVVITYASYSRSREVWYIGDVVLYVGETRQVFLIIGLFSGDHNNGRYMTNKGQLYFNAYLDASQVICLSLKTNH